MMVKNRNRSAIVFNVINYTFLAILALSCILPVVHVLALSLSDKAACSANQVKFLPVGFHLRAYEKIIKNADFLRSFWIAVLRVIIGTTLNMVIICLTAYPLSREVKDFRWRNLFAWFVFIPMLITGGLIPTYLQVRNLPTAVPMFSVIIMMNFFRGISNSLVEAAQIEGAGHMTILLKIFIPVSTSAMATLSLFAIVGHWNEWFQGLIYINDNAKWPLQTYLRQILLPSALEGSLTKDKIQDLKYLSNVNFKSAQIFVSMIPILLIYPFLQKYFVTGLTLGSVKE